jgi:hypothetical protein
MSIRLARCVARWRDSKLQTKIAARRPFGGNRAASIQSGCAAANANQDDDLAATPGLNARRADPFPKNGMKRFYLIASSPA